MDKLQPILNNGEIHRPIPYYLENFEIDECGTGRKKESIAIRFCRKKFKCIVILMVAIIALCEAAVIVSSHVDLKMIQQGFDSLKIFNHTTTNDTNPFS